MRGTMRLRSLSLFALWTTLFGGVAVADVKMPAVFSDHMVVQSGMPMPVWGWADPGEQVTVTLGEQTETAAADAGGKWSVKLAAMKAGGRAVLKIRGKNALEIQDVLVGEVWLCSGQSNMAMTVERLHRTRRPRLRRPNIRRSACSPWTARRPKSRKTTARRPGRSAARRPWPAFSAAAYFFGRELHQAVERARRADQLVLGRHAHPRLDQREGPRGGPRTGADGRQA